MTQLFDVILTDLRSSTKNVNRLLSLGILFALVGHFYVVEPYFQYKSQERAEKKALEEKENEVKQLSDQLDRIKSLSQGANNTLAEIEKRIDGFPDHLRNMLEKIQQALLSRPSSPASQTGAPSRVEGISIPPQITTLEKGAPWYVEKWFNDLIFDLESGVVKPVLKLKDGQKADQSPKITDMVNSALEKLRTHLAAVNPNFWRSYQGGKVPVAYELQEVVKENFDPVKIRISKLLEHATNETKNRENEMKTIKKDLEKTQGRSKKLESRLNSLESPLGRIPLGLIDLIVLFPLLIVILIAMVTFAFQKSGRLYITLWREFKKDRGDADSAQFQQFADCWYMPPYPGVMQPLVLVALLVCSAGIFVWSSLLVIGEPELFTSPVLEFESFKPGFFTGAYVVGVLVIVGCMLLIGKTLSRVSQKAI